MIHPLVANPVLINFFKLIQFPARDSSSGSAGLFHISLRPQKKYNRDSGRKNEQTNNMDLCQLQAQEREFCDDFVQLFVHFVDYRGRAFCAQLLQKLLRMPAHFWLSSLIASLCWPSVPWTPSSTPTPRLPSSSGPVFSRTFFSSSTSGFAGDLEFKPFVWVSRQNRQRDCLPGAPPTLSH